MGGRVVLDGIAMGESVRWHEGKLWFCDWMAGEVIRVDDDQPVVVARHQALPLCIDWLPGGDLLLLDGPAGQLLRLNPDGTEPRVHADLRGIGGDFPWNDIALDERGFVYVNNVGFRFPGGEPAPGLIAVVAPDGEARRVAGDVLFPNGMAVRGSTLLVAESYGSRLTAFDIEPDGGLGGRRVWAQLADAAPDGICFDADEEGTAWYADVPNRRCVHVREGGEVLQVVEFEDGVFDCVVTPDFLYAVTANWPNLTGARTGKLHEISRQQR